MWFGREDFAVEPVGQGAQQPVGLLQGSPELLGWELPVLGIQPDLESIGERGVNRLRQPPCDYDVWSSS